VQPKALFERISRVRSLFNRKVMLMKKIVLTALLASATAGAFAQTYMGAGVGFARTKVNCSGTTSCTQSDKGVKLYAGYSYTPMIAGEVGYVDFGNASTQQFSQGFLVTTDVGASAMTAALALRMDLMPSLTGVARIGAARVRTNVTEAAAGVRYANEVQTKTKPYGGLALEYSFAKQAKAVLSADFTQSVFDGTKGKLQLIGLGVQYAF
jgi:hypothetical protein